MRGQQKMRSLLVPRRRGGQFGQPSQDFAGLTTPSAPTRRLCDILFDVAATPPLRGGEYSLLVCKQLFFAEPFSFLGTLAELKVSSFYSRDLKLLKCEDYAASSGQPPGDSPTK